jgi:hypothetical protein
MNATDRLNAVNNGWIPKIPEEKISKTILEDGTIEYRNSEGELHNINDLPAIYFDGSEWCLMLV